MGAFKTDLKDDTAYLNGIGRFDIQLNGDEAVQWFQNGKELPENAQILKFEMVKDGNKRSLIVKNVTKADMCKYAVACGDEKKEALLKQMNPFVTGLKNADGYSGGIAVFECEVHPGNQVTWYFGDKKISRQAFSMLKFEEKCEGNMRRLIVKNITSADLAAKFSCEAKGEKTTAELKKKSPWVTPLENAEGPIQGIAVFELEVEPATQVTWFVGNKAVTRQNFSILKFEPLWDGNWRKLLVKNITDKDYTEFTCEAKGEKCKAKLVKGSGKTQPRSQKAKSQPKVEAKSAAKTAAKPPTPAAAKVNDAAFASKPKNLGGNIGKIEVFECTMKNANETVTWFKESKKIDKNSFSILKYETIVDGAKRKLIIKNIANKDGGNYHCEASDGSKVSCNLNVGGKAVGPAAPPKPVLSSDFKVAMPAAMTMSFGLIIPRNLPSNKHKEYVMTEVYNKDIEANRIWVRSPASWNTWMRNPEKV